MWIIAAPGEPEQKIEIIGVTRDTKYRRHPRGFEPLVLRPHGAGRCVQPDWRDSPVKPRGPIDGIDAPIERAVAEMNPAIAVRIRVARQAVRNGLVRERLMAALSGAFGVLAGLLARSASTA